MSNKLFFNLGCGNKLYNPNDGWVNVDIVPPKANHEVVSEITKEFKIEKPQSLPLFMQSELKELTWIEDEVADEVHGYHVIEHFYLEDVPLVLQEWYRILKPGGIIVLEQPDVVKCAKNFLKGLQENNEQLWTKLGILGFYGAGRPHEPYMSHKWGWFPESLAFQLKEAGFKDVGQAPAQTHAKDLRDFRLVGVK